MGSMIAGDIAITGIILTRGAFCCVLQMVIARRMLIRRNGWMHDCNDSF